MSVSTSRYSPAPDVQPLPASSQQAFENPAVVFEPQSRSYEEQVLMSSRKSGALQPLWHAFRAVSTSLPVTAFSNPAIHETTAVEALEHSLNAIKHSEAENHLLFERQARQPRGVRVAKANEWYNHAQVYFSSGQLSQALECAEQALLFDAQNGLAWQLRGSALLELQRYNEALQAFEKAVALRAQDLDAWQGLGRTQMHLSLHDGAMQSFAHVLESAPDNVTALFGQACCYSQTQQYQTACDILARVVELKPTEASFWSAYGEALAHNHQLSEALECYEVVSQLQPEDADNWVRMGGLLRELGRVSEAIISYNIALDLAPQDFFTWFSRSVALAELGHHEQAAQSYQRALEFNNSDPESQYHLALTYLPRFIEAIVQGRIFNAKELWRKAVKLGRQASCDDWYTQELHYLQAVAALGHHRLVKSLIAQIPGNELLTPLYYVLDWLLTDTPPPDGLTETVRQKVESLMRQLSPTAHPSLAGLA